MTKTDWRAEQLVQKLRRILPLAAHGRPVLTASLGRRFPCTNPKARLTVTDVFYAGAEKGLMCRINAQDPFGQPVLLIAPITQLAFNRRHPIAREVAAYRERRTERAGVTRFGE